MSKQSIWFAVLALLLVSLACNNSFRINTVKGSGNVISENRDVSGFSKVIVSGMGRVILSQGNEESLRIETDDNLMQYITTEVTGDTLEIGLTDDLKRNILNPSNILTFYISFKELNTLNISGAASFEIGDLVADNLDMNLSGAGNVNIDKLEAGNLTIVISGAGNVELSGEVQKQDINLRGLGRYIAEDLKSQQAVVRISAAGGAKIWAVESLDVTISGAGNVEYYGNPTLTEDISGAGKISYMGDK